MTSPAQSMHATTIIARNYLAHARVLAQSFLAQHPSGSFSVLVLDDVERQIGWGEDFEVIRPTDIGLDRREFHRMAMLYSVLELSTAVRPWLLRTLLERGHEAVVYVDPDIVFYASIEDLFELAAERSIVLTPHTTEPIPDDGKLIDERAIRLAGAFNLGFIGVGRNGTAFLDWWSGHLARNCRVAVADGEFVDQRYIDLVPGLFEHAVVADPTVNVAWWNANTRRVEWTGARYEVNGQPLRFFHFSGFAPERPWLLSGHQGPKARVLLSENPGLARLCADYRRELLDHGYEETSLVPYWYDTLPNGMRIDDRTRQLYLEAYEEEGDPPPDPFDQERPAALTDWLNEPVDASGISRYFLRLRAERPLSQLAFPDLAGKDGPRYVEWLLGTGRETERIPPELLPRPGAPLRRPAVPRGDELTPGVNVVGFLEAEVGIGEAARQAVGALDVAGVPYATVVYRTIDSRQAHAFRDDGLEAARHDVNLLCLNADTIEMFRGGVGPDLFRNRYSVGLWWWEVQSFPERMRGAFDLVDEVWTGSEFSRAAIATATSKPVLSFPVPVVVRDAPALPRSELGLGDHFLFLFVYDFFSVFRRKNPLGLVEAFRRAFTAGEGPVLILKSVNGKRQIDHLEELRLAAADRPDIRILDGYLEPAAKDSLMATCDCYVSLHRSEGFGLTIAEAMARGKPVIATAYGGNLEFMTDENSFPVPYDLVPVGEETEPYPADAVWAEPDLDEAARLMREVFEHREEAAAKARRARLDILEKHSPERAGAFMTRRLNEIRAEQQETAGQSEPQPEDAPPPPDGLQRAVRWLASGPSNPWDAPSGLLAGGRIARRVLRRALRPYESRQREFEIAVVEALKEDHHRVVVLESLLAERRGPSAGDSASALASYLDELRAAASRQESKLLALEEALQAGTADQRRDFEETATGLGQRLDSLEARVARVAALTDPVPERLGLFPGMRATVVRTPDHVVCKVGKRVICSLATGPYLDLLGISATTFADYARRWGWDLVLSAEELSDGRPPAWGKIPFVRELLDGYEWVLWLDADAIVVDLEADIAGVIEPGKDLYLVEHEWGDEPQRPPNSGVFLIRATDWSRRLLDRMWASEHLTFHPWWDNAALMEILGYDLEPARLSHPNADTERVSLIDLAWNSVPVHSSPTPHIKHYAGSRSPTDVRESLLDDLAAMTRRGAPGSLHTPGGSESSSASRT